MVLKKICILDKLILEAYHSGESPQEIKEILLQRLAGYIGLLNDKEGRTFELESNPDIKKKTFQRNRFF